LTLKLERFKVTRHQISRRILRMNKLLEKEFGEHVAEKRGWHWALTVLSLKFGETRKDEIEKTTIYLRLSINNFHAVT